jgi:hypothetical protein
MRILPQEEPAHFRAAITVTRRDYYYCITIIVIQAVAAIG